MMKIKYIIIVIMLFFLSATAIAQDCIFIPDKTLCGISIKANHQQYINVLGEPDGKINMGPARIGLVYGPKLLLIFWHDKLWEVHSWETNPNIDFWDYVHNDKTNSSIRLVFKNWSPWGLSRKQVKRYEKEFPVNDADQFGEDRKAGKASLSIFYAPFYSTKSDVKDLNKWESYKVQHISIKFNEAPTNR